MDLFNPYIEAIAFCSVIVISYFFTIISRRTNIPSVLLLIALGVGIQEGLVLLGVSFGDTLFSLLEILGIFGLIMIVLEAALDLKLTRDKLPMIIKSFFIALLALVGTSLVVAYIFVYFLKFDFITSLVYAVPLAVMSSAIIIPSVAGLPDGKREFLIYESTFSDILGIMYFYFLVGNLEIQSTGALVFDITANVFVTILLSVVLGYVLVWLFQQLDSQIKLFLLIAVLVLLYSVGKLFHLSSLIIILIFGLMLNNYKLFFRKKLKHWINGKAIEETTEDFHLVTAESAFVVRTFFFVVFGMTLDLQTLLDKETLIIGCCVVLAVYVIRWIVLKAMLIRNITPELWVAPRGLITILLFFAIPADLLTDRFSSGILLATVLVTSIVMTIALITRSEPEEKISELTFEDWNELDAEVEALSQKQESQITK